MSLKPQSLYEFGPFRLDTADRTLWRDGQMVPLTPKALDTLVALVESGGRLIDKENLLKAVWPDTFVEEGNLAVQISLLRKVFGEDGYIETVPRRGYRFVAPITEVPDALAPVIGKEPSLLKRRLLLGGAAATVAAGAFAVWRVTRGLRTSFLSIRSVAVLPFQMLRPNPGDELLGLGLADAVITKLGGINKCIVRPTSAVRQFDQTSRDPVAVGAQLGVEAVLDASIQSAGDRIRVNVQLIRVSDGQHLWTETFDLRRGDLFTLEDELATQFSRSLFGGPPTEGRYQPKPEAHRLYTLGRYHRNRWNTAGQRKAIEYFEQAIAIDPGYAAAYAMMANSWILLGYLFGMPPREAFPKAQAAAEKALSLDDRLSEAHHALGSIRLFFDWNFADAERRVRRAIELNPNNADSVHAFGVVRTVLGKGKEGISALQLALDIDPTSQWRHGGMTFQYACANRIDAAIEEAKKAHELDPTLGAPMHDLFNLHMVLGRYREAVEWYLKQAGGDAPYAAALREKFQKEGIQGFLRARLARGPAAPMAHAQLHTYLGERDEAVGWIEKAEEQRQSTVRRCEIIRDSLKWFEGSVCKSIIGHE
jgi:DNA-binding winged helix-turn-helix (wHTH) protein/TolB-like protein/tetratricopeptide (TPR) repeat protein